MHIQNSTLHDVDLIIQLYNAAVEYQKRNGYNLWPDFPREMIEKEIAGKRNWKILEGGKIACVFSVLESDPTIWEERNNLHRIATNPEFKGRGLIKIVRDWAIQHARQNNKKYVRMDTWGNNLTMRNYYIQNGFEYIGQCFPQSGYHYGGPELSLLQIEV
jgi:GNAT superfamily N-acetyltransferase